MNSENMSQHSSTKNFGKFQCKLQSADVMTFFLVFTACFCAEKRTCADLMTLKKPVLLLHSENMVTLDMVYYCSITAKNENEN